MRLGTLTLTQRCHGRPLAGIAALLCALGPAGCEDPAPDDGGFFNPTATDTMTTTATTPGVTSDDVSTSGTDTDPTVGDTDDPATTTQGETDTDGMPPEGDGAQGVIVLGESHPVGLGDTLPILNANFYPNPTAAGTGQSCGTDVDGCQVILPPECLPACVAPAVCTFNDACEAECVEPCATVCPTGQECYNPFPGAEACRESEGSFTAGRLDFFSTNQPIELYPPYQLSPGSIGALVGPDKMVRVEASGAGIAGFGPFEAMVTTSESIFSNVAMIMPADAFGTGPLTIDWMAGEDEVTITLTVNGATSTGTVVCEADDSMGSFDVPRAAIDASIPTDTPPAVSIGVTLQRTHTETTTDIATVGSLLYQEVLPVGSVDFQYVSIETGTLTNM